MFMVTNQHVEGIWGMHNVALIANQHTLPNGAPEENIEQTKELLTKLSRLYAIKFSAKEDVSNFAKIMKAEGKADKTNNGIAVMLKTHSLYKERYLKELLEGNELLVIDGSTKEITNPHKQVLIADVKDNISLNRDEYVEQEGEFKKSSLDKTDTKLIINTTDVGGMVTFTRGVVGQTNLNKRSSDILTGYTSNEGTRQTMAKEFSGRQFTQSLHAQANKQRRPFNPNKVVKGTENLVAVFDSEGNIKHAKYALSEAQKEKMLDTNHNFDKVLGAMMANVADKKSTQEINEETFTFLKKYQEENFIKNPRDFVSFGKDVKDKTRRDDYRKLPKETQEFIKELYGVEELQVPRELYQLIFGNRKWSISSWIKPSTEEEKITKKMGDMTGNWLAGKLNTRTVKLTENVWQEMIKMAKDTIVIKNPIVLMGNEASNAWLNWMMGVSYREQLVGKREAIKAITLYSQDTKDLFELKHALEIDPNRKNKAKIQSTINLVETSITTNPLAPLFKAGLSQTIVEDITNDEAMYSYKTKYASLIAGVTDKVPAKLQDVGKTLAIAHESHVYKFLKDLTQMSDLTSRYILHKHNLKKGMKEAESIKIIDEVFVNYDLPTHPGIQYMNDMGLLMFTKFFIRIQKVMVMTMSKAPAKFFGLAWLNEFLDLVSIVQESSLSPESVIGKFANPFGVMLQTAVHNPVVDVAT